MERTIKTIGHPLRHNVFVAIVLEGKTEGKTPRKSFFEEMSRLPKSQEYGV